MGRFREMLSGWRRDGDGAGSDDSASAGRGTLASQRLGTATGRRMPPSDSGALDGIPDALAVIVAQCRKVADLLPVAVYACQAPHGEIRFYNRRAAELWGRQPVLGDPLQRFCGAPYLYRTDGSRLPHEQSPMAVVLAGGKPVRDQEVILERPDGVRIVVRVNIDPITDASGRVVGAIEVFQDVTEQRQLLDELRASEARLRQLLMALPAAVYTTDCYGRILLYNDQAAELWGRRPETDTETWCGSYRIFYPDGTPMPHDRCPMAVTLREGRPDLNREILVERPDGKRVYVLPHPEVIRDASGNIVGGVNMLVDITQRKLAEEALRESQQLLAGVLANLPGVAYRSQVTRPWNLTFASAGVRELTGRPASDFMQGRISWQEVMHPDDVEVVAREIDTAFREGRMFEVTYRIYHASGELRWVLDRGRGIRRDDGQPKCIEGYVGDLTAQKRAEEMLREADRRKDEFLAILAHELRNPLAPLRNALEMLRLGEDDRAIQHQAYELMDRQLEQMVRLIDDLLDVSRITRNKLPLRKERIPLASAIQSALETTRPVIQQYGHQLDVTLPTESVWVEADLTRLAQVFSNLLNNAAKYTEPGGRIWLTVQRNGHQVSVHVRDTGVGIAAEHLARLFQMFSQVDTALERSHGGLGIGLALVRGLIELHGGTVEARSDGPGQGSEFIVRLPVLEPISEEEPQAEGDAMDRTRPARRILVVDDNKDSTDSLAAMLSLMGHPVRKAYDGLEALEVASAFRPELMLLDIGMPGMNGYQVARSIRQQPWGQSVVMVAMTGWGQENDKRQAREAGFDHHLTKPVAPKVLEELVQQPSRVERRG